MEEQASPPNAPGIKSSDFIATLNYARKRWAGYGPEGLQQLPLPVPDRPLPDPRAWKDVKIAHAHPAGGAPSVSLNYYQRRGELAVWGNTADNVRVRRPMGDKLVPMNQRLRNKTNQKLALLVICDHPYKFSHPTTRGAADIPPSTGGEMYIMIGRINGNSLTPLSLGNLATPREGAAQYYESCYQESTLKPEEEQFVYNYRFLYWYLALGGFIQDPRELCRFHGIFEPKGGNLNYICASQAGIISLRYWLGEELVPFHTQAALGQLKQR
jgi:hypothetical protein